MEFHLGLEVRATWRIDHIPARRVVVRSAGSSWFSGTTRTRVVIGFPVLFPVLSISGVGNGGGNNICCLTTEGFRCTADRTALPVEGAVVRGLFIMKQYRG